MKSHRNKTKPNTIAFRVDPEMLSAIDAECKRLGVSRGELVRAIVAVHFEVQPARLLGRLDALDDRIKKVSKNQVRSLFLLLTRPGPHSLDEAKEFIRNSLPS